MIKQKRALWWVGKSLTFILVLGFLLNSSPLLGVPANAVKNEFYPGDAVRISVIEIGRATDRGTLDVSGDY